MTAEELKQLQDLVARVGKAEQANKALTGRVDAQDRTIKGLTTSIEDTHRLLVAAGDPDATRRHENAADISDLSKLLE